MRRSLTETLKRYNTSTLFMAWISVMVTGLFILEVVETW